MQLMQFFIMLGKMREFKRNERMSRPEFEAMQLKKFRKLAQHAAAKSAFYADIVKDRNINLDTCVPTDFPVLTKSILMANFDRIVTDKRLTKHVIVDFLTRSKEPNDLLFDQYHVLHTSGSSGEMGYFVYSEKEWTCGMSAGAPRSSRPRAKVRKKPGRRKFRMAYYAAIGGHFAGVSMVSSAKRGIMKWFIDVALYEVNAPLPQTLASLNELQPDFLGGYTTALKILATKQREGLLNISPAAMNVGGEGLTLADKAFLESTFGCEVVSGYGCTEHMMMGLSDPDGATMTLFDDDLVYEFFDDHSLVTNLFNYTLPLIRYRMSDILRPIAPQPTSSPYIVIDSLVGRTEKMPMFVNRDGAEDFIHPISVVELFIAGVTRFQMRLIDKTSFQFAVCLDPQLDAVQRAGTLAATEKRLREFLEQKLMSNVTFTVLTVADLPVDPKTGKFKLIVDAVAA
jgi:phenylacetate-CoA ligase